MARAREQTQIRVIADNAGHRTVAVAGLLDASAVASVCAAGANARERHEQLVLDLLGVTSVDGDCLKRLARALRESGTILDVRNPKRASRSPDGASDG